ncbi:MAG: hypothetical protein JW874_12410 [Spirochaetales bacterium]|nr:hypothetical protein [Spirochaetales bacterium]
MTTGISDIGIYIPEAEIEIKEIIEKREDLDSKNAAKILGAARLTGQQAIRFPRKWEDTVTFAAEAVKDLYPRNKNAMGRLRYLGTGTETGIDCSKPLAAYLQGLLNKASIFNHKTLSTFQTQHACASGTLAMLDIASKLQIAGKADESGLCVCSDIAHYSRNTTAEITQGAGSVSLLIENNPALIELDLARIGYASEDVDDFYRPLDSKNAFVKGQYSMKCYQDSLIAAFDDYAQRAGKSAEEIINTTDYFICHAPFAAMPKMALRYLLEEKFGLDYKAADSFIISHVVGPSSADISKIGNLYSASLYFCLAMLLRNEAVRIGEQLAGRNILFASYGSGNTMIVFRGSIADSAIKVIEQWDFASFRAKRKALPEEYERWMRQPYQFTYGEAVADEKDIPANRFYLKRRREDGYYEYEYKT